MKDKIVDKNKKECYAEDKKDASGKIIEKGSYVNVIKTSKTDVVYKGYLYCSSCGQDGNCEEEMGVDEEKKPIVNITLPGNTGNALFDETTTIDLEYLAKGENALISSYSYKIYVDNTLKFNSGTKINGKKPVVNVHEPIFKYLPGKIKVVATITNSEGETKSYSKTKDYSDAIPPSCGRITYDGNYPLDAYDSSQTKTCGTQGYLWSNKTRHVWVVCNDIKGIGCSQPEFSKELLTEGAKDTVIIKDNNNSKKNNGEDQNCSVMKCIDRTTPKVTVNIYKSDKNGGKDGGATKSFVVDSVPEVKTNTKNETYSTWLNKANYPNGVIVEVVITDIAKIATAKSDIKSFSWYQNAKNQKENAIGATNSKVDLKDNIKTTSYTKTQRITDDGVRKQNIVVKDYADNITTYNLILKIDRTPPTVPKTNLKKWINANTRPKSGNGLADYTNNTWFSGKVYTYPSGSVDSPDVSGFKEYQYTTTGKTTNNKNQAAKERSVEAEGESTIVWRSCDNAGNCSNYNTKSTIKLDRTNPVCKTIYTGGTSGSNGWYVGGTVKATGHCSDQTGLSGCKEPTTHIQTVSSNSPDSSGTKKSIKIYDKANNSTTCNSTIKYDKSKPYCSFWVSDGGAYFTNYGDNGPSGVSSKSISPGTGLRATTYSGSIRDVAGNYSSCSTGTITVINANPYYTIRKHHCGFDHWSYYCTGGYSLYGSTTCRKYSYTIYGVYCSGTNTGCAGDMNCADAYLEGYGTSYSSCSEAESNARWNVGPYGGNVSCNACNSTSYYSYRDAHKLAIYSFTTSDTYKNTVCTSTSSFSCGSGTNGSNYYTCWHDGTYYCTSGTLIGGAYCRL